MKTIKPKWVLVVSLAGLLMSGCGPKFAPWYQYRPTMEANESFFSEFYHCVGTAVRSDQMAKIVKTFAPKVSEEAYQYYSIPEVSELRKLARTLGAVMASDQSKIEAKFKKTLGVTPSELDANLSACFALANGKPDVAGKTAEDLRLYAEVVRKSLNSYSQRDYDSYNKNYRRTMLALSVLEMGMAKQAGPDPEAIARFNAPPKRGAADGLTGNLGNLASSLGEVNRAAASGDKASLNGALGKAEKAMDATEADGANLNAMIDTAVALDKGSINEEEAAQAMGKLNKARERNAAAYESAGENDESTVKENVDSAKSDVSGVKANLEAGKQAQCKHLLKDLREAKEKCDAGKQIFCEAFGEKRSEFIKKCGQKMLPKELAK